jgi:hypothetical protein
MTPDAAHWAEYLLHLQHNLTPGLTLKYCNAA